MFHQITLGLPRLALRTSITFERKGRKALEFLPSNRRTYRWRPGGPTAQRSLITVAYNQYVDAPLKKFAAHVDTFNPVGPGLPPPDARDHHDAPGAHAETTPSFKRSTVVMFPCSSGIRSLTKSQESSLGTNVRDVEPAAFLCRL